MTKVSVDMIGFYFKVDVPESSNSDENTPFADAADDEAVSIPKDKYELMIDDLDEDFIEDEDYEPDEFFSD